MSTKKESKELVVVDVRQQVLSVAGAAELPAKLLTKACEYRKLLAVDDVNVTVRKIKMFAEVAAIIDETFPKGKEVMRAMALWSRAAGYVGSGSASVRDYAKLGAVESAKVLEAYSDSKITQKSAILIARGVTHRSEPLSVSELAQALANAIEDRAKGNPQATTLDKLLRKAIPATSPIDAYASICKKIDALNTELQELEFDACSAGLKDRVTYTRASSPVVVIEHQGAAKASQVRNLVDHESILAANESEDFDARVAKAVAASIKALGIPAATPAPELAPKRGPGRPKKIVEVTTA